MDRRQPPNRFPIGGTRSYSCLLTVSLLVSAGIQSPAAERPIGKILERADAGVEQDYPGLGLDHQGNPWIVYLAFDGNRETVELARRSGEGLEHVGQLAGPGIYLQPGLAAAGDGTLWAVYSRKEKTGWNLQAKSITNGKIQNETLALTDSEANDVYADVAADRRGRVWVAWQVFDRGLSQIKCRYYDPGEKEWSDPIDVSSAQGKKGGSWLPRLAFDNQNRAWIAFDQPDAGDFNVKAATITGNGEVQIRSVASTDAYEAAVSIAASPGGDAIYISWERGIERWGRDGRNNRDQICLNADKHLETARIDSANGKITRLPCAKPAVAKLADIGRNIGNLAVNLPQIGVDGDNRLWMACRYAISKGGWNNNRYWQIALLRYDAQKERWSEAYAVPKSSLSQNRINRFIRGDDGTLFLAWPADLRTTSAPGTSGIYLTDVRHPNALAVPDEAPTFPDPERPPRDDSAKDTPDRARSDRYTVDFDGQTYRLYWGDLHRHTDLSPDGTLWDGSVVEAYRYAVEVGELDFLGTSDHTDIGPGLYTVYEWWQTQKLADVFQNSDYFVGLYAYEREQRFPWGHRNVVFAERNGPIVYINRETYQNSRWAEKFPVGGGGDEIAPKELWKILRAAGNPVTVISHTSGDRGMGTDWERYEEIDNKVENLVEIYQGKRVNYEGVEAPQPTVGLSPGERGQRFWDRQAKGTYQMALREGHRLGIFASSDHFSTHVSFGGVFANEFTRHGLIEGMNARRTIGATDKIFLHYTCNDHLMGTEFTTSEKPKFTIHVEGTAPVRRVTILKNELAYQTFRANKKKLNLTFTDEDPIEGMNRYYVRLYQRDGNMAWASPIWVTYQKN